MALISLEEGKIYLRVDSSDDDAMIDSTLTSAGLLVRDVGRVQDDIWEEVNAEPTEEDRPELIQLRSILRPAILYTLGYLYEHRDAADHHDLTLTLRSLLFSVREGIV